MVNDLKSRPWFDLYVAYKGELKERSEKPLTRRELRWAYRFARLKHKFLNPKEPEKWYEHVYNNYLANKVREPIFKGTNWFLATAFIGQFGDEVASKFEAITGISKRHAQNVNVFWSSIDHAVFVYSSSKIAFGEGYSEMIKDAGTVSFYITGSVAAFNLAWSTYRLFHKGEKVYPALGYAGIFFNTAAYLAMHRDKIKSYIKENYGLKNFKEHASFVFQANHEREFQTIKKLNEGLEEKIK